MAKKSTPKRDFNWINFGNLFYYDKDKGKDLFYFNLLLSHYERNPPNPEYARMANDIGNTAKRELSTIPGIDENNKYGLLPEKDFNKVIDLLKQGIIDQRENEIRFVKDKKKLLKEGFGPKYIQNDKNLSVISQLLDQIGEGENVDYDKLILLINIVEYGLEHTKAILKFENDHLLKLDEAIKKNTQALENQIIGLAKHKRIDSGKTADMIKSALAKRDKIRVRAYQREKNLMNTIGFKRYMKNMTTVDYKVAEWINKQAQKILDDNLKTYKRALENNFQQKNGYSIVAKQIEKNLRDNLLTYANENLHLIITDSLDSIDLDSLSSDLVNNYTKNLETEIIGYPENFGLSNEELAVFKKSIIDNQKETNYATDLYAMTEIVMKKIRRAKNAQKKITEEQDFVFDELTKDAWYQQNIDPITDEIEKIQKLLEQLKPSDKVEFEFDKIFDSKTRNIKIIINGNEKNAVTISGEVGIYQRGKNLPANLRSMIVALKTKASRSIRDKIENIITSQTTITKSREVQKELEWGLSQIKVDVTGPGASEIINSINWSDVTQIATGHLNIKSDHISIVATIPTSVNLTSVITGILNRMHKDPNIFGEIFDNFQKDWGKSIFNGFKEISSDKAFTDYDKLKDKFFEGYQAKEEAIKKIKKASNEIISEIEGLQIDEEKKSKMEERIAAQAAKYIKGIKDSLYVSQTMKTYRTYQNDIGFIGGSLGSTVESQLNSFNQLFDAAGITIPPDLFRWLHKAIINCSPISVIGEEKKDLIETYLGTLAIFAMFDEGEAELINLQERIKNIEQDNLGVLHLYRLNGIYYPGSFVLKQVLDNVNYMATLLASSEHSLKHKNVAIYNPMQYKDLPNRADNKKQKTHDTQPWSTVAKKAEEKVKIQILFLAGLLDTVGKLYKAFNEIQLPT